MKRLTEMFRAEIDNGLFESDTEKERAADCQPQQQQADYYQWNETEQVKVEAELKQEISNAVRHAAQHKADEHNNTNKAADDEERKEAPTAPLLLPLPLHTPRHHRTMTDSEKDAAAAISLLSPRPPLAPLTASSVRASPPSTTVSSIRSSPARSRFVFPTDGLLALSPHRSTSSPHSAATAASSYSSSSLCLFCLHYLPLYQSTVRSTTAPLTVRLLTHRCPGTAVVAAHSVYRRHPSVDVVPVCCSVRDRPD